VLAHPLFNQPGQGSSEIRELIKSIALPKPPGPQPQVNQGHLPQGEINMVYLPYGQQLQGSQPPGQFSVSSVPYVGVNQLPEKISVSNVRYLHENSPDALRSVGEVPGASLAAYGARIPTGPQSNAYDSMEQLNANLANSQNRERSDSLSASSPQGSGAFTGEGSPLRNDDPRGAYDPLPPSNDDLIPDGKREVPDDSSPLQKPEIRYL